jgi:hypothetical protein
MPEVRRVSGHEAIRALERVGLSATPAAATTPAAAARDSAQGEDKDSLTFASRPAVRRLAR